MRVHHTTVLTAVLALALAGPAGGQLLVGVTDNEVASLWGQARVAELGLGAVRVFIYRQPHETYPDREALALVRGAMATGARVWVTVTGRYKEPDAPNSRARRLDYGHYIRTLVERTGATDIVVWNEPNFRDFWGGRKLNPGVYVKLLAVAYDVLEGTGARTWAFALERSNRVRWFVRRVARAYERSGRKRPLFYGVAHHPYPTVDEPWDARHPGTSTFTVGDTGRLLALLDRSFAGTPQCRRTCRIPVAYTETGWPTQRMHLGVYTADEQATILRGVIGYLEDYPRVVALLNFELRDSAGWPTGIYDETGEAKPSANALQGTVLGR